MGFNFEFLRDPVQPTEYGFAEHLDSQSSVDLSYYEGSARKTFFGPTTNVDDFVEAMLSTEEAVEDQGNVTITRRLPCPHPQYPFLYVDSVSIEGVGAIDDYVSQTVFSDGYGIYDWSKVTVNYRSYPYNTEGDDSAYLTMEMDTTGEMQSIDGVLWRFESGQRVPAKVALNLNTCEFRISWLKVPMLPQVAWKFNGKINGYDYYDYATGILFPAETVRLARVNIGYSRNVSNNNFYTINYGLAYRPFSWNMELNPFNGVYEYIWVEASGGTKFKYDLADFSKLFTLAQV